MSWTVHELLSGIARCNEN